MTNATHSTPGRVITKGDQQDRTDALEFETYIGTIHGRWLPKSMMDCVRKQVLHAVPNLLPDRTYTVRNIFGEKLWLPFQVWQRIVAGQCMVHLIESNLLPLTFAGRNSGNAVLYRLK